jgi:hypothetical protein
MSPKQELLQRAAEEYRAFQQAVQGLTEAQLTEPWLGTWGVREIVAHIVGWQQELRPALERMARGERPMAPGTSYEDVEAWNSGFAAAARDRRATELLAELGPVYEAFVAAAAAVPEERFEAGRTAYRIVDLNSAHHYREHGDEIRAWRRSRGL